MCCKRLEKLGLGNRLASSEHELVLRAWVHKAVTQKMPMGLMLRVKAEDNQPGSAHPCEGSVTVSYSENRIQGQLPGCPQLQFLDKVTSWARGPHPRPGTQPLPSYLSPMTHLTFDHRDLYSVIFHPQCLPCQTVPGEEGLAWICLQFYSSMGDEHNGEVLRE